MIQETRASIKLKYHEHWVNSLNTSPFELDESKTLIDYSILMGQNPEAYDFYRHQLNRFYKSQHHSITEDFFQIFAEIKTTNIEVYNQIISHYSQDKFAEEFSLNRDNSFRLVNLLVNNELNSQLLFYYQQVYETETVLDILLTLATYFKHNSVELMHENFRDSKGKLRKGSTIQYIVSGLKEYEEICKNIKNGYIPKVRNLIGHNNYKFKVDEIFDVEDNFVISKKELLHSLYSIQEIHNTILNFFAFATSKNVFEDGVGCIGCSYIADLEKKELTLPIYVLWCFYDENKYREISQNIVLNIDNESISTKIGKTTITGNSSGDLKNFLSNIEIFNVIVFSIRPIIKTDIEKEIELIEMHDIEYEITHSFSEDIKLEKNVA